MTKIKDTFSNINAIQYDGDFTFQIQSTLSSMPRTYQKIARYIIDNPQSVSKYTISQLANKTGTCASTITRFCQSLGYTGFPQFKYAAEIRKTLFDTEQKEIEKNDSGTDICQKFLPRYIQALDETVSRLNGKMLETIADAIVSANKIYFFGHGGSGSSANIGQILFMQIGLPAVYFSEVSTSAMAAAQLKRGDIAIGISSSGNAKTPVDALRIARGKNATTIGITGFGNSHLAYHSDLLLNYNQQVEDLRFMHISRLCEISILGILQNCILSRNFEKMNEDLRNAKNAFMAARY